MEVVDAKMAGIVCLGFGGNSYLGGTNQSSLHSDFATPPWRLTFDNRVLIEAGQLIRD